MKLPLLHIGHCRLLPRLVSSRIHHFLSASSQLGISLQVLRFADLVEKHSNELTTLETYNNGSKASKSKIESQNRRGRFVKLPFLNWLPNMHPIASLSLSL
ncbi:aldehyde dehydrogenase family 2 member B4, mitochondrial [Senna tora]|uniref:Aldehyde dehydrogenase family 2 member B4, mitochondrial n=1 Tax=Senna tora TaxID=362788 RepID=A0A834W177_9FABA|nr:aldehyde dehydrogenase family 2 member B4, mitochondrial [Senna tora]